MKKIGIILFLASIVLFVINYAIFWSQSVTITTGGWVTLGQVVSSIISPILFLAGLILIILGLVLKK
jgi:hypothetical protein